MPPKMRKVPSHQGSPGGCWGRPQRGDPTRPNKENHFWKEPVAEGGGDINTSSAVCLEKTGIFRLAKNNPPISDLGEVLHAVNAESNDAYKPVSLEKFPVVSPGL